jgi:GTPase SAR1 family protein
MENKLPNPVEVEEKVEEVEEKVEEKPKNLPLVLIILGMAGTGKTTFVETLCKFLAESGKRTYNINLDPAVLNVKFPANIDIRDSVKYKAIMKEYQLGPNGAILTSLNIFAAQFDQVVNLIEEK